MADRAKSPVPEGMGTVTIQLWFEGNCRTAIDFYKRAFGADVSAVVDGPDGEAVMHAMLRIGDTCLMMADAWPGWEQGPVDHATASMWIYTDRCDALFEQAAEVGCEVIFDVADMFWGDRVGKLKDPFGHCWAVASHQWDYTPEEIAAGQAEWLASMRGGE